MRKHLPRGLVPGAPGDEPLLDEDVDDEEAPRPGDRSRSGFGAEREQNLEQALRDFYGRRPATFRRRRRR